MKKFWLLALLAFSFSFGHAKELSKREKGEMLKQFVSLQEALRASDTQTVLSMIRLERKNSYIYPLIQPTKSEDEYYGLTTQKRDKYRKNIMKNLSFISKFQINMRTQIILERVENDMTTKDKQRQYYLHGDTEEDEGSAYNYYLRNGKKIKVEPFEERTYSAEFYEDHLNVSVGYGINKAFTCVDGDCEYGEIFIFKFINNKLTLVDVHSVG